VWPLRDGTSAALITVDRPGGPWLCTLTVQAEVFAGRTATEALAALLQMARTERHVRVVPGHRERSPAHAGRPPPALADAGRSGRRRIQARPARASAAGVRPAASGSRPGAAANSVSRPIEGDGGDPRRRAIRQVNLGRSASSRQVYLADSVDGRAWPGAGSSVKRSRGSAPSASAIANTLSSDRVRCPASTAR
jgi:hypothetical protein